MALDMKASSSRFDDVLPTFVRYETISTVPLDPINTLPRSNTPKKRTIGIVSQQVKGTIAIPMVNYKFYITDER